MEHLNNPRSVVPASIIASYPWLAKTKLNAKHIGEEMRVQQVLGVPYTDEMIAKAQDDLKTQATTDAADSDGLQERYPKAQETATTTAIPANSPRPTRSFAYLQMLGTLVDFKLYDNQANVR